MIIRYQIGDFSDPSWRALAIAATLMRHLEPKATIHVTHQVDKLRDIPAVDIWLKQDHNLNVFGKYVPGRLDHEQHEVWLDNDHILWGLPPAWKHYARRPNLTLAWHVSFTYYGSYVNDINEAYPGFEASPGMFGLPPGDRAMSVPVVAQGCDPCQEEYGGAVAQLARMAPHVWVYDPEEVAIYCPEHNAITNRKTPGQYGVHLPGLNRGWNSSGEKLLDWIVKEQGLTEKECQ